MKEPKDIIDIPTIDNIDLFYSNRDRAEHMNLEHCPCCGKELKNPEYFINSIYGGCAYHADDKELYTDAWIMGVGPECRHKFPEGYVFK